MEGTHPFQDRTGGVKGYLAPGDDSVGSPARCYGGAGERVHEGEGDDHRDFQAMSVEVNFEKVHRPMYHGVVEMLEGKAK